ncbi:MAG: zf-HC2 domain-containing protein [Candidatus Rokubacteria bacterium]|nr:zf-HC2 domain-containing protein [Candidatus Rokubacteria bacterium]
MLRCQDIVELLDAYLDGALDAADAAALGAHLAGCEDCMAFMKTYRGTVRKSRELSERQLPPELRERLLTFLSGRTRPPSLRERFLTFLDHRKRP